MNTATQGLTGAARRVADHARSLVQLELQLAVTEIKRKAAALAAGIGLVITASGARPPRLLFGLAAADGGDRDCRLRSGWRCSSCSAA